VLGQCRRRTLDPSHGTLLVLAVLGQSRVFLWCRVILFDHAFYRYAVQLLEHEGPVDHRVRHYCLCNLTKFELVCGRRQFDAAMRLDDEAFFEWPRGEMAVVLSQLIQYAGSRALDGGA
jgi:hypothetical protein